MLPSIIHEGNWHETLDSRNRDVACGSSQRTDGRSVLEQTGPGGPGRFRERHVPGDPRPGTLHDEGVLERTLGHTTLPPAHNATAANRRRKYDRRVAVRPAR